MTKIAGFKFLIFSVIYVEDMESNLIPPFMMRLDQLKLNEEPKFLAKNPTPEHHSVYRRQTDMQINFYLKGIVSFI